MRILETKWQWNIILKLQVIVCKPWDTVVSLVSKLEVPKCFPLSTEKCRFPSHNWQWRQWQKLQLYIYISTNSQSQLQKGQIHAHDILLLLRYRLCFRYTSRHNTPPTVIPTSNIMRHIATNTPLFMWSSSSDNWSAKKHTNKNLSSTHQVDLFSHFDWSLPNINWRADSKWCQKHFFCVTVSSCKVNN